MSRPRRVAGLLAAALLAVTASRGVRADGPPITMPGAPASTARALADVAARVSPTIVSLHVVRYAPTLRSSRAMERARGRFKGAEERRDKQEGVRRTTDWPLLFRYESRPSGPVSGVMVEPDGLVLTSRFNVEGAVQSVRVELADGRVFPGEVLGWECDLDIAAVRVKAPEGTRFAALPVRPRKEPAPGTFIAVVGTSWGRIRYTASAGMVSALERLGGNAIQLAAKLNYGNTGGAVVDLEGRLVGVACHVRPFGRTGLNSGVGFATAAHRLHDALPRIARGDRFPPTARPFIGIRTRSDTRGKRLFVGQVVPGSGAEEGGVKVGDLLLSIAGTPIVEQGDVALALRRLRVGQVVTVVVNRGGVTRELAVQLRVRN